MISNIAYRIIRKEIKRRRERRGREEERRRRRNINRGSDPSDF